jgi:hypothetical protein
MLEQRAAALRDEETHAAQMQRDAQRDSLASKAVLQHAVAELKKLTARDIAVVKSMSHPPCGVVLVVRAMCLLYGMSLQVRCCESPEEIQNSWAALRHPLNDPSFLPTIIGRAFEYMQPEDLYKLRITCSDPSFDDTVIERASSTAKTILHFVQSAIPYHAAVAEYQSQLKDLKAAQEHVLAMKIAYDEAMGALSEQAHEVAVLRKRQAENIQRRAQLTTQLERHASASTTATTSTRRCGRFSTSGALQSVTSMSSSRSPQYSPHVVSSSSCGADHSPMSNEQPSAQRYAQLSPTSSWARSFATRSGIARLVSLTK